MQDGAFSESVWTKVVGDLAKMSNYVGGCIEFYDDTVTKLYPKGYIRFQSSSSGCWAQAGYVGHHSSYQEHQERSPKCLSYQNTDMLVNFDIQATVSKQLKG